MRRTVNSIANMSNLSWQVCFPHRSSSNFCHGKCIAAASHLVTCYMLFLLLQRPEVSTPSISASALSRASVEMFRVQGIKQKKAGVRTQQYSVKMRLFCISRMCAFCIRFVALFIALNYNNKGPKNKLNKWHIFQILTQWRKYLDFS